MYKGTPESNLKMKRFSFSHPPDSPLLAFCYQRQTRKVEALIVIERNDYRFPRGALSRRIRRRGRLPWLA
jgi:hypothetical protein